MNYDPNDLAVMIFSNEVKTSMKPKQIRELAHEACVASDIFWQALGAYAATKPALPPTPLPPQPLPAAK